MSMTRAVQDNLIVTLSEAKTWLRLDDSVETRLIQPSEANSVIHRVEDARGLKAGDWITLGGVDAKISYVDYSENNIILDRNVSIHILSENTPLTYHHQNSILMNLIEAAKVEADEYMGNDFQVPVVVNGAVAGYAVAIPAAVKTWVLGYVAHHYAKPEVGLQASSVREVGSNRWDTSTMYEGIRQYRLIPF